jgi:hypothetical protein
VRGAFLTVQRPLQPPVLGLGVDHVDQVTPGPGQVGGIQTGRGLHHHLLPPRPHHPPLPLPPAQTPDMGHPVTGRPEVKPVLGQVTGLGLAHRPRLHRRSRRDQHLQTLHHTDQHLVGLGRPQHLPQPRNRPTRSATTPAGVAPDASEASRASSRGSRRWIDIRISNQRPPTIQPISTTLIPLSEIIHRNYFPGPLSVHKNRRDTPPSRTATTPVVRRPRGLDSARPPRGRRDLDPARPPNTNPSGLDSARPPNVRRLDSARPPNGRVSPRR